MDDWSQSALLENAIEDGGLDDEMVVVTEHDDPEPR